MYPLTFQPIFKERVWGGRRLEKLYGKMLPPKVPVGESWEISDRPGDASVIANGPLAGKDLHWLVETRPDELLGATRLERGRFPLLIKILDASEKLSLQVHPPATAAAELDGEPKTEMWYIAEAAPGAELYVGLRAGCTRDEFAAKIEQGTVADCFHRVKVKAGDAMFLPSGRVHAIGAGLVIFEIQQNSDTTYRVFDWNRVGLDGKPRELHAQQSLASIDFDDFEPPLVQPRALTGPVKLQLLASDKLFSVTLAELKAGEHLPLNRGTLHIIGTIRGRIEVESTTEPITLSAGQFCLIPAAVEGAALRARSAASCLCVRPGKVD
ncbi:MAG TPA: type I phosphomannose isomerase catalytic subunit [Verrucomicrobiae bacterium]|nr:type I phosphomannose isomerase catalytic subunit [Verrucomicrobiae bacterium]